MRLINVSDCRENIEILLLLGVKFKDENSLLLLGRSENWAIKNRQAVFLKYAVKECSRFFSVNPHYLSICLNNVLHRTCCVASQSSEHGRASFSTSSRCVTEIFCKTLPGLLWKRSRAEWCTNNSDGKFTGQVLKIQRIPTKNSSSHMGMQGNASGQFTGRALAFAGARAGAKGLIYWAYVNTKDNRREQSRNIPITIAPLSTLPT